MPLGWAVAVVALWVVVVFVAVVQVGILRRTTLALEQMAGVSGVNPSLQGPPVGARIPAFTAIDRQGLSVTDSTFIGEPSLMVFLSLGCGPCHTLAKELGEVDLGDLADRLVIVTERGGIEGLGIPAGLRAVAQQDGELSQSFDIVATPYALALDSGGVVRSSKVPNTVAQLLSLSATLSSAVSAS